MLVAPSQPIDMHDILNSEKQPQLEPLLQLLDLNVTLKSTMVDDCRQQTGFR